MFLRNGIKPDTVLVSIRDALQPNDAGLLVHMLHRAADVGDLVRAHGRVPNEDHLVVGRVGVEHVPSRRVLGSPARIIAPQILIEAVVEVVVLQVLEFGSGGGE